MNLHVARSLAAFCTWLDQTPLSQAIQTHAWVVPTVQTIHILTIAVVMGSILMIDLRLLGILDRGQPVERVFARFLPFIWWPLLILFATGTIMIIGEPARSLRNPVFQLKVVLILAAVSVTLAIVRTNRSPAGRGIVQSPRLPVRLLAVLSLTIWVGVIFAGRWIAYYI
ncbi:MAG: DUF6644 family protein [Xanthobacteraceae bacterium]|jgi:hypothetical protein